MYRCIPCNGDCFHCPYPDCIYTGPERTPFDLEQERIRQEKARIKRELAAKKAAALIGDIEAMKAERDSLGESINRAKAAIMQEIGDAEGGQCDGWRVSWKAQIRNSIDGAALKRDYPEIYQKYSKQTTSRVFRLTKVKEDKAS